VALDSTALVTVDEARTYLGASSTEAPPTDWLELVINGLSAAVAAYTRRTYIETVTATPTTKIVSHDGGRWLEIPLARSVVSLRTTATPKDAGSWAELDDDSWVAEPQEAALKDRIHFLGGLERAQRFGWHFDLYGRQGTPWPREAEASHWRYVAVEVTALWGGASASEVPENVRLALLMWLQSIHRRDRAYFSADFAQGATAGELGEMPADVRALLDVEAGSSARVVAV
jgi:hypothetical protein